MSIGKSNLSIFQEIRINLAREKRRLIGDRFLLLHHIINNRSEKICMNKAKMIYFEKEDILHLTISEEVEAGSIEISPNITAEINEKWELIGI